MKMQAYSYSILALLTVCRALAGEPAADEWGPLTNNAQMAISVTSPWIRSFRVGDTNAAQTPFSLKKELKVGEPFSLLVRIRNFSTNQTLRFLNDGAYPDAGLGLACVVISPSGKDVSAKMASPSSGITVWGGSGHFATARPGQTAEFEFPLSQLCKLEEIGTYKITARKSTVAFNNAQKVIGFTSNTLSVSVVPGK